MIFQATQLLEKRLLSAKHLVEEVHAVFIDKEGNLHKQAGLEWTADSLEKFCDNFCLDEEEPESAEYWRQVKEMMETHEPLEGWEIAEIKEDTYFIAYVL